MKRTVQPQPPKTYAHETPAMCIAAPHSDASQCDSVVYQLHVVKCLPHAKVSHEVHAQWHTGHGHQAERAYTEGWLWNRHTRDQGSQ